MRLVAQPIALKSSPAQLASHCADEPWFLFLDSCEHPQGRYDMLFRQPLKKFIELRQEQPWPQYLQQQLQTQCDYSGPSDLPFQGGLAGAFSYDAGRVLEQLPEQALADIDLPDLAVGYYSNALIFDKRSAQYWLLAQEDEWQLQAEFWQACDIGPALQPQFRLTSGWQSNLSADEYQQRFKQIIAYLNAGDCYQINLAQRFSAEFTGHPWDAYRHLRASNKAPFSVYMKLADGALLSLSPERFLKVDANGQVETKPIKGTLPRDPDPQRDAQLAEQLQNSSKDRAENVMIVDLLRNDLSRLCRPHTVHVPKLFAIESYPAVHHLVSTVVGELQSAQQAIELLGACFPGGSITGAPKIRAMEIIEELEPHRRSFYCGSFGYFSQHGQSDTNIAIRTLVLDVNTAHCWAGGGIVADSQAANEYQETLDKVAKILPILEQLGHD